MASIDEWNAAQLDAWNKRHHTDNSVSVQLVACTHRVKQHNQDITLLIYRVRLSDAEMSEHTGVTMWFKFEAHDPSKAATPIRVLAWAPFKRQDRSITGDSDIISQSSTSEFLDTEALLALGTAELELGKRWEESFTQNSYGSARSSEKDLGTEVCWEFSKTQRRQDDGTLQDFHLAIILKQPHDISKVRALPFTGKMMLNVKVGDGDDDDNNDFVSHHAHDRPVLFDPTTTPHFCGSGERVRKLLQPDGRDGKPLQLGHRTDDALLAIVGVINDYSYSTFHKDMKIILRTPLFNPPGTAMPEDPFLLDALLHPNEHILRLEKIRTRLASECQVAELLDTSDYMAIDLNRCRDLLRRVVRSFDLLHEIGLVQTSLIMLADDPTRDGVIQAIALDISEFKNLLKGWADRTNGQPPGPPKELFQVAQKLFLKLGIKLQSHSPDRTRQGVMYCVLVAMATASYAGSHCHPIGSDLGFDPGTVCCKHFGFELSIRSCRFACLDRFIGGPVWVFSLENTASKTPSTDMLLSITPARFDNLWGPLVKRGTDLETILIQTEGGLLYKASEGRMMGNHTLRADETPMHWVPAQPGSTGFLVGESECHTEFLPMPFDTNTKMLIGSDELESHHDNRPWQDLPAFETNPRCKVNAMEYRHASKTSNFVYPGTEERRWLADTKAMNVTAGFSGSGLSTSRTWKVRPATSWKASLLLYSAQRGRNVKPIMDLRVGLEWSICTGNARRTTLLQALTLAFPKEKSVLEDLLHSANMNDSSREKFMNYLNDLGHTGVDERNGLKLLWPALGRSLLRLDDELPKWTNLLKDGAATCCFAVGLDALSISETFPACVNTQRLQELSRAKGLYSRPVSACIKVRRLHSL